MTELKVEPKVDEDFFPLELIVNRRMKDLEEYINMLKESIREKPEEVYFHEEIQKCYVIVNEYKYIIRHKIDILKTCK